MNITVSFVTVKRIGIHLQSAACRTKTLTELVLLFTHAGNKDDVDTSSNVIPYLHYVCDLNYTKDVIENFSKFLLINLRARPSPSFPSGFLLEPVNIYGEICIGIVQTFCRFDK